MGLDGVELIMAMEEAFGVELKDDEVVRCVTPRLIGDLIFSQLSTTDEKTCQTQRAFYILRRGMMQLFRLPRKQVTLDTAIRQFIPRHKERDLWPQLGVAVAARRWPHLARPRWMDRSITAGALAIWGAFLYISIRHSLGLSVGFFGGLVVAGLCAMLATKGTRQFALYIPARFETVRDLIPLVLTSKHITWTRAVVSEIVKQIVMEQLGVPESKYTEDSDFMKDFGMD